MQFFPSFKVFRDYVIANGIKGRLDNTIDFDDPDTYLILKNVCTVYLAERDKPIKIVDILIFNKIIAVIQREAEFINTFEVRTVEVLEANYEAFRDGSYIVRQLTGNDFDKISRILYS